VKDYGNLPAAYKRLDKAHVDVDHLVIFLLEGRDMTADMHHHLLECTPCRSAMVDAALDALRRWPIVRTCQTQRSLLSEWRDAAEMYTTGIAELTGKAGKIADSDLLTLAKITEVGRKLTKATRAELDEHIAKHRC